MADGGGGAANLPGLVGWGEAQDGGCAGGGMVARGHGLGPEGGGNQMLLGGCGLGTATEERRPGGW